jgi:hypothetical protein
MRSPIYDLIPNIITLLDNTLSPTHPDGSSIMLRAYQSVPENAANKYILVELVNEERSDPQPKDRDMVDGSISIKIVERTKEDNAGYAYLRSAMDYVQIALSPTLTYNVSSGTDGSTISFYKGNVSQETQYNAGDGKVLTMTLIVNYKAEYNIY